MLSDPVAILIAQQREAALNVAAIVQAQSQGQLARIAELEAKVADLEGKVPAAEAGKG